MPDQDLPPLPEDTEVTWGNFRQRRPTYDAVKNTVCSWGRYNSRQFAGIPRESDVDFEDRLYRSYVEVCGHVDKIIRAPTAQASLCYMSAMTVMGAGFASRLRPGGVPWQASLGPQHVYEGFAAIVAGRYRQSRETEEGDTGMTEVAETAERFSGDDVPPSSREIDASRDHHNRVALI